MLISNLKFKTSNFLRHPLFSGSLIMVIGGNLTNFVAYLYHLILGRMLGPSQYGVLVSTISLIGLLSITFSFLGLVIVKFVSVSPKDELDKILSWFNRKSLVVSIILLLIIILLTPLLSSFLKISLLIIVLTGPILSVSLVTSVYKSFLQGLLKFKEVVIVSNAEFFLRLITGVVFVYFGFSVFGAVIGVFFAALISLFLSFYFLRSYKLFLAKVELPYKKRILAYAFPLFIASLANNSLITVDLLLVKHFFDSHSAGLYAALSNLGKIIFYGAAPVASVMFPLVSKRFSQGQNSRKIFALSFLLTAAIAAGVLASYWLFPDLAIKILYGAKYLEIDNYLFLFGIVMTLFTFASLLVNYYLSKGQTKVSYLVLLAALLQIVGIWFYHDSILSVVRVSLVVIFILLALLLTYFVYEARAKK